MTGPELCDPKIVSPSFSKLQLLASLRSASFSKFRFACNSQVLGRQVSASSVSKFSKSQVSASLGKFRQDLDR